MEGQNCESLDNLIRECGEKGCIDLKISRSNSSLVDVDLLVADGILNSRLPMDVSFSFTPRGRYIYNHISTLGYVAKRNETLEKERRELKERRFNKIIMWVNLILTSIAAVAAVIGVVVLFK